MAKKKKETTGLLMAVTPVTVREEKNKGGLLESDRQGYAEGSGNPIPIEDDWSRRGIESTEGGSTVYTQDDSKSVPNPIPMTDDWTKRGSYKNNQGHTVYFQESGSKGIEKYIIDNNNNKIETAIPIEDDWIQRGSYQDRGGNTFIFQETGEGLEIRKEDDSLREIIPRSSPRFKEALTEVGAGREERRGKKGGGLLESDRQRYQEGSQGPVSDFDYGLDADPPIELQDQIERQDSLITNINSFVQDRATILARDPGYSRVPSRWSILDRSLYRQGISPLENDINSAWTVMRNTARRENIDLSRLPAENEQEIRALIESLAAEIAQKDEDKREPKQEGGLPEPIPQEAMPMPMDIPMAMEDSMVPEEPMVPDEQMEDNYLDFIISESLDDEEEVYLMDKLEADPQLSIIFDKLIGTATEFSGSGPVDGPGSEVSDSIPARLSDGEFVITAKASDEIGPDNLQAMMSQAETQADQRQIAQEGGVIREDLKDEDEDSEIKKGMMGVNPRLQMG